jgi:hypothetical protein
LSRILRYERSRAGPIDKHGCLQLILSSCSSATSAGLRPSPLAVSTRRAYRGHPRRFVEFLASWSREGGDPLTDSHARDYAVRDFKSLLKTVRRAKPASVNLALAAIDHLYRYLGAGRPDVRRGARAGGFGRSLRLAGGCPTRRCCAVHGS